MVHTSMEKTSSSLVYTTHSSLLFSVGNLFILYMFGIIHTYLSAQIQNTNILIRKLSHNVADFNTNSYRQLAT